MVYLAREGSVRQVLDTIHPVFQQIRAAIEGLPDEVLMNGQPHLSWLAGQPFSGGKFFAHFHEAQEPDMGAWLMRVKNNRCGTLVYSTFQQP